MSQRECAGFNWPPFVVSASEPVSTCPEAVNRTGPVIAAIEHSVHSPFAALACAAGENVACRAFWAVGVGHPARKLAAARSGPWLRIASIRPPSKVRTPLSASAAVGVGQPASHAVRPSSALMGTFSHRAPSFQSRVVGVGHPVEAIADVRGTDARSRKRDGPEGVTQGFQVSVYKVDPRIDVFARNLLSKDC